MAEVDFQAVFDEDPVALAVLSPDLVFVAVNRVHEELFGRTREEMRRPGLLRGVPERVLAGGEASAAGVVRAGPGQR
ncbi:hypothetical protein [Nonomuraea rubra]|uniref:PAS domain-containing protein n=1 Tax=Nonomuraea rubra TaxID=46180 RepID=A0A7X0P2R3_9ACTN|nr:hypothetical protein [Nonomuraea rubra]MBB6554202.1 PAS domain-containing protein [Nonomuraea rubra]